MVKKVGLALGAGAARGLAHIGVIKVLIENNINIDYIAGASIGSIVGAYYAVHGEVDSLEKEVIKIGRTGLLKYVDIQNPINGVIKGDKIKKFMGDLIRNKEFKDTLIKLNIVSTDVMSGKEVIISKGKIAEAVRASISLPGIFAPVKIGDKVLMDGGIINSTPIDVVKKMGADVVIAVDLPFTKLNKEPKGVEAFLQSFEIMRRRTFRSGDLDEDVILIEPDFKGDLNGHKFYKTEFITSGEIEANKHIKKIKKIISSNK